MRQTEGTREYRSSIFLVAVGFVWTAFMTGMLASLCALVVLTDKNSVYHIVFPAVAALASAWYAYRYRYAVVTVSDQEVAVRRGKRNRGVFSRDSHTFTSSVLVERAQFIFRIRTLRHLVVVDADGGSIKLELPNLAKNTFNLLMADLWKTDAVPAATGPVAAGGNESPIPDADFVIPREAMLKEYRRSVYGVCCLVPLGGVILAGYAWIADSGFPLLTMFLAGSAGFLILAGIPIIITLIAYIQKGRSIPSAIAVTQEAIVVDGQSWPYSAIGKITVTPPEYKGAKFANRRVLTLETDYGKKTCDLGYRRPSGVLRTVFVDYAALCDALQTAAENRKIPFIYDL